MQTFDSKTLRIEALRELVERLCAPDLTLAESKVVRDRLAVLLGQPGSEPRTETNQSACPPVAPQCWLNPPGAVAPCCGLGW